MIILTRNRCGYIAIILFIPFDYDVLKIKKGSKASSNYKIAALLLGQNTGN